MWELIRDGAILALCFAYAGMCLAAVAFWIQQTWAACRKNARSDAFDRPSRAAATLVTGPIPSGRAPKAM